MPGDTRCAARSAKFHHPMLKGCSCRLAVYIGSAPEAGLWSRGMRPLAHYPPVAACYCDFLLMCGAQPLGGIAERHPTLLCSHSQHAGQMLPPPNLHSQEDAASWGRRSTVTQSPTHIAPRASRPAQSGAPSRRGSYGAARRGGGAVVAAGDSWRPCGGAAASGQVGGCTAVRGGPRSHASSSWQRR